MAAVFIAAFFLIMSIYPENSLILAPLAGFTDLPFRHSARRYGCFYAFTEMIDAGSLVFGNVKTMRFLERGDDEPWLGLQLVGADCELLAKAVEIVNQYNFQVLDFNLGCPAPKVAKKGEGAALGRTPDKALKAFEALIKQSRIPVTAKIRILDEQDIAPTLALAKRLEEAGAAAITVHGRVMKAFYSGPVFFDVIKAVRSELSIQVIANGGVMDLTSYKEIKERTGCDCVMLARGVMGNPWLFKELAAPDEYQPPSEEELSDELERHVLEMVDFYGEELALKVSRKIILDYMKGRGFPRVLKSEVSYLKTCKDFELFMVKFREGITGRYKRWLKLNPDSRRRLKI
jgi:tRNA-dihydrouridine synthase B